MAITPLLLNLVGAGSHNLSTVNVTRQMGFELFILLVPKQIAISHLLYYVHDTSSDFRHGWPSY